MMRSRNIQWPCCSTTCPFMARISSRRLPILSPCCLDCIMCSKCDPSLKSLERPREEPL
ncbi:hypothetical protein BCR44DRAFT_1430831, partial [Catenaria anguillulae PL171]